MRDIVWLRFDGQEMTDSDWQSSETQSLGVFLGGDGLNDVDAMGNPVQDDHLLLMLSSTYIDLPFTLPDLGGCGEWELLLDTYDDDAQEQVASGGETTLHARSVKLYRCARNEALPAEAARA